MKKIIKSMLAVAMTAGVVLGGTSVPAAQADPLPGGGSVNVSQSADGCKLTAKAEGTTQQGVISFTTYPMGSDETQVDELVGVNPSLTADMPRGVTVDTYVEFVLDGRVVFTQWVRSSCGVDVYSTPGEHFVNGREWRTYCEDYSQTTRCFTDIWATKVTRVDGHIVKQNGWVFNNLTYQPSPRSLWANNPLGRNGEWTAGDGRKWRTECDTPTTGRNGCRSYTHSNLLQHIGDGVYEERWVWVFNNIVRFS